MNISKIMVVSALLLFLFGVSVGPYMVTVQGPAHAGAKTEHSGSVGTLSEAVEVGTESEIVAATADAYLKSMAVAANDNMRGWARAGHAHANLESLWTLVAALLLLKLSIPMWLRYGIGGAFIVGSWIHGGLLVAGMYGVGFAMPIFSLGIGPILIILGAVQLLYAVLTGWPKEGATG